MLEQLNIAGKNKIETAIGRIQMFEPPEGYYLAFSGGKDSVVIKALADMAGVKYDAHYSVTSADPPELIRFIREYHSDVEFEKPRYKDGSVATMWNLIPEKNMPPTMIVRYCCAVLKETDWKTGEDIMRWWVGNGEIENADQEVFEEMKGGAE